MRPELIAPDAVRGLKHEINLILYKEKHNAKSYSR